MARIRTIKPDFFRHEELYEAEKSSGLPLRIAFAGLWTVADREGRFRWKPSQIKLDVLPFDSIDMTAVLDQLREHGFIQKYSVLDEEYGLIPSFKIHQVINSREAQSRLPGPDNDEPLMIVKPDGGPPPTKVPNSIRRMVFERDDFKCTRCGDSSSITIDHIFPQSIGGTHAITNLRTLCMKCNSARPVQGEALIKDLASDAYTLHDMQRMCFPVQGQGEGKGREKEEERNIQRVCVALAEIFGREWESDPQKRMPALHGWYRTIEEQAKTLNKSYDTGKAEPQVRAYLKYCQVNKRKLIGTPYKVAETILQSDWINLNTPDPVPKKSEQFTEAAYNKTLWSEDAWLEFYGKQIRENPEFRKHFKINPTPTK